MPKKQTQAVRVPQFEPGQIIGGGMPAVISDKYGMLWVVNPNTGTAKPVEFSQ